MRDWLIGTAVGYGLLLVTVVGLRAVFRRGRGTGRDVPPCNHPIARCSPLDPLTRMSEEQPMSGEPVSRFPAGAAPDDHPGWRLAFRLVDLGCSSNDSTGRSQYLRITAWFIVVVILVGLIIWLTGPWLGLTGAGAYGLTKATKVARRKIANKKGGVAAAES
ncbi:hypothetical protein ACFORH_43315 [Amycolatopsis roodepoortensis]|uniref:Transmembrane protein n=1 Tax=Amycolatopsis roodepoortensis TaxID=700274 RepID=A0ABR9LID1_9PSEU|nr:hypothetical protein [Amycolatopsis roodepoortensis]MBE1580428.1 hypothetical protein [Amycolatopsis roodepoortensis]